MSNNVENRKIHEETDRTGHLVVATLWVLAFSGAVVLAIRQYAILKGVTPSSPKGQGGDFWGFLHAARQIAEGRSPYNFSMLRQGFGYVYSPLVALILLPFQNAATESVWHAWTLLSIGAMIASGAVVAMAETPRLVSWRRPVMAGIVFLTALEFQPTKGVFSNGQTDAFMLLLLAAAVYASERKAKLTSGVLLGLGTVIKTWPGGAVLTLFRRGYAGRRRSLVGFIVVSLLAPILALAVGGFSGLMDFIKTTFDARTQDLVSYSVWGAPKLLFSASGLARPLVVSSPMTVGFTIVLVIWVTGLVVLTLRGRVDSTLGFWNLFACVILLLPAAHADYTIYFLPLLWTWLHRMFVSRRFAGTVPYVSIVTLLWWTTLFHLNWDGARSSSSLHVAVPFFANLAVVTVSVLGDLRTSSQPQVESIG